MQIDAQDFLRLVEKAGTLVFWDTETTGKDMDYGSIATVSIKPFGQAPVSFARLKNQSDKYLVRDAADRLAAADCWVTYFGKGFDVGVMNTRLLKWGWQPLKQVPHIDLYFSVQPKLRLGSKSQAQLLQFLQAKHRKLPVTPDTWSELATDDFDVHIKKLITRCESDVRGLEEAYKRTKHLIREIKR